MFSTFKRIISQQCSAMRALHTLAASLQLLSCSDGQISVPAFGMLPPPSDADGLANAADKAAVRGASLGRQNRPFIHAAIYDAFWAGGGTAAFGGALREAAACSSPTGTSPSKRGAA